MTVHIYMYTYQQFMHSMFLSFSFQFILSFLKLLCTFLQIWPVLICTYFHKFVSNETYNMNIHTIFMLDVSSRFNILLGILNTYFDLLLVPYFRVPTYIYIQCFVFQFILFHFYILLFSLSLQECRGQTSRNKIPGYITQVH